MYSILEPKLKCVYRNQGHTKEINYYPYEYKTQEYETENKLDVGK